MLIHSIAYEGGFYEGCGFDLEHMSPNLPINLLYYVAMNQGTHLLPRVRAIRWAAPQDCELHLLIPLISPTVRELDIDVSGCTSEASSRLLRALNYILPPDLRTFNFEVDLETTPTEDVTAIIRQQDSLRTLKLPSCVLDPGMFKPGLQVLEAYCTVVSGLIPQQLLDTLADTCPRLCDIRMTFSSDCNLRFDSIRPLLRCSQLIKVDLEYPGQWNLEESDIKAMGNAWPRLEALNLCCRRDYPGLESSHGIPIGMLPSFARYLSPKLRKLALFLNTTNVPLPPYEATPFCNLEFFAVGNSPLDTELAIFSVVAYLDAVLPTTVNHIYSKSSFPRHSGSVFQPFMPRYRENPAWGSVEKLLSKLRQEFRGDAAK
ncbi:hypothetical protein FRC01_014709 [Tulasnella sp. 417]|nr:hypothetical protein FRC01_014709 [Tulasnella sp. 417]